MTAPYQSAVRELLFKMADDNLIMGHRNSEWVGLGPILEEDIALNSIAQDQTGYAWRLYQMLHQMQEADPDSLGFLRQPREYKCCHLVEYPIVDNGIGEYDFTLARHFFFDHAQLLRWDLLRTSSFEPLAQLAAKAMGEVRYHVFHANVWLKNLLEGNEESRQRMTEALMRTFPLALGIFEPGPHEAVLNNEKIFAGEDMLKSQWLDRVTAFLHSLDVELPDVTSVEPVYGGRYGYHSDHFDNLIAEMGEVLRAYPDAQAW